MKITTAIIILVLIIGGIIGIYLFIQDQANKKELASLDTAEFIEKTEVAEQNIASQITLSRQDGVWSSNSDSGYAFDLNSLNFQFTGYKVGGSHDGTFENMNVTVNLDESGNPVSGKIVIDASSVKTDASGLDTHLQTDDFFGVASYPEINVDIKEIKQENNQTVAISDIFMKGVTRTIAIPVSITKTDSEVGFSIDSRINISDFSIAYGPVRDDVRITLAGKILKK